MNFDRHRLEIALNQDVLPSWSQFGLEPQAIPFKVHTLDQVSSTNTVLWELLQQGAIAGTAVIASEQQAGRGQWGRQWSSPVGGLYLSLALATDLAADQAGLLTLSSAWGIATALRDYQIPVLLKWPNDLVVNGLKLGGILTETRIQQGQIRQVVIGVGINWRNAVPETGINLQQVMTQAPKTPISSLDRVDRPLSDLEFAHMWPLERLAAIVLQGLGLGQLYWQQSGSEALLSAYEALFSHQGDFVRAGDVVGQVVGLSRKGELHLRTPDPTHPSQWTNVCLPPGTLSLGYRVNSANP